MASAIPQRDAEFNTYLFNWKTLLTATPAVFGMTATDATAISAQYTAWNTAYTAATNLLTRTRATVAAKDAAKVFALSLLREQYGIIKANPSVSNEDKISLGIRVSDPVPTPIPPPSTYPVVSVRMAASRTTELMAVDNTTPTKRARPAGTIGMLVVRAIGNVAAISPDQCQLWGISTRVPFLDEDFTSENIGKTVTYFARWTNGKGQEGPWSAPVSLILSA
jgi:hypothetical protein